MFETSVPKVIQSEARSDREPEAKAAGWSIQKIAKFGGSVEIC